MAKGKMKFIAVGVDAAFHMKLKTMANERQITMAAYVKNILAQHIIDSK
jgi:predicted DNA-binding ribbon-helix-helix protein